MLIAGAPAKLSQVQLWRRNEKGRRLATPALRNLRSFVES
jgi:hypothetical protein